MRVLVDTNVVLDLLIDRAPFAGPAARLFSLLEQGAMSGHLCATTVTTVHYLVARARGGAAADEAIERLLALVDIAAVNRTVLLDAVRFAFADFEDAVLHEAARHAGIEVIVTRDQAGFRSGGLTVYTPEEFLGVRETL